MADLAKIKRNVARMVSLNAPESDIDEYISSQGVSIEDVRNYKEQKKPDMNFVNEKSKEIGINGGWLNDDGSVKGSWVNSGLVRKPVAAMKGVANSSLNPAGFITKGLNYSFGNGKWELPDSIQGFEAKDNVERGIELAAEQANDFAAMAGIGNAIGATGALGKGVRVPSKVARFALMQSPVDAAITGAGGGLLSGYVNTKDPYLNFGLNVLGGSLANAAQGGLRTGFNAVKQLRSQPQEITDRSLLTAIGNKNSVRRMREGIQSGNTELQTKASEFAQKMSDFKASKGHADIPFAEEGTGQLKDAITLPEFKKAKMDYDAFKSAHSGDKIPANIMRDFYKNHPFAKKTMADVQKNVPSVNKSNANTIGSVDKLKSQLSKIARGNSDNAGYADAAAGDLRALIENSSKGFKQVNKAYAKAINHQKNYENLLFANAKNLSSATVTPLSQLTGMGIGGTIGAGLVTGNPYAVAAGLGIAGSRAANRALRRQAGSAVARGATPLIDLIKDSMIEYGVVAPQRAGLQTLIEKSLKGDK